MPTIKELDLNIGDRVFSYSVEKHLPRTNVGGLSLASTLVDPDTRFSFHYLEIKDVQHADTTFRIICSNDWYSPRRGVGNLIYLHSRFVNFIAEGVQPDLGVPSNWVSPSQQPVERFMTLTDFSGTEVGELIINQEGIRWGIKPGLR